jgi:hypothetical protein
MKDNKPEMTFESELFLAGKTATGLRVPEETVLALGAGKRPPVRVTINKYTYRSTIAPMCGEYFIPVAAAIREASGCKAGDLLRVTVELDREPRIVEVPVDFGAELVKNETASRFFDGLSYSNKKGIVTNIESAKSSETRSRRIAKAIETLAAGKI